MLRSSPTCRTAGAAVCAMGLMAAVTGCTMCPDPYDYTGPVPNGTAPQNDFRARSNGILPLGNTPRPWPQIVSDEATRPGPAGIPTLAEAVVEAESADLLADTAVASVLVPTEATGATDETGATAAAGATEAVATAEPGPATEAGEQPSAVPPAAVARDPADDDDDVVAMLLPPLAAPPEDVPPVRETPGWKPRR